MSRDQIHRHEGHLAGATLSCQFRCARCASTIRTLCRVAGLVPAVALAARAGLEQLVDRHLTVPSGAGAAAGREGGSALVAGMVAGADSIDDMDLLRHGGMGRLVRRGAGALDAGHVPARVHVRSRPPARRGRRPVRWPAWPATLRCCPRVEPVTYLDIDDTVRATYGYAKQGAGFGYSGVKGLNALLATISTPSSAPVIVATRLRKGSTNSARGAARLVADALRTTRSLRCRTGLWCCGRTRPTTARRHRRCPTPPRPVLASPPARTGP